MGELAKKRIAALADSQCVFAFIGLAFYWPLFRRPFVGTLFSDRAFELYSAQFCYFLAMCAMGLVMIMLPSAFNRLSASHTVAATVVPGALASTGTAVLVLTPGGSDLSSPLMILGFILLIAGFTGLSLRWVSICSHLGERALVCLPLSYLLSFAIGFVEVVPIPLRWVCMVLPAASALFATLAKRGFDVGTDCGTPSDSTPSSRIIPSPETAFPSASRPQTIPFQLLDLGSPRLFTGVLAILVVALMAACCETAAWRANPLGYATPSYAVYSYIFSAAVALGILAFFLTARDTEAAWARAIFFLVAVLLVSAGLCGLTSGRVGVPLLVAAQTSLRFFLWMLLIVRPPRSGPATASSLGLFLCIDFSSSLVAIFIVPTLAGVTRETAGSLAMPLALGGVLALAGTMAALAMLVSWKGPAAFAGSEAAKDSRIPTGDTDSGIPSAGSVQPPTPGNPTIAPAPSTASGVPSIAPELLEERFGLTAREVEVARCLAQGHSVKRTAQMLFLAPSTVQSYSKTIYRKLGIHSKQELIDLLR